MNKLLTLLLVAISIIHIPLFSNIVIEKGDRLTVYLIDETGVDLMMGGYNQVNNLSRDPHELTVSAFGRVFIPHVGVLNAEGKTPQELEQEISTQIKKVVNLKNIAVLLSSPKFNQIYVLGEVKNPGMYQIDATRDFNRRIMNIINMAGGFSDRANLTQIKVQSENGNVKTLNLMDILTKQTITPNITLLNKDTIIIPQSTGRIYVLGEVLKPGGYQYMPGAELTDYIAEAGGQKDTADIYNIGVLTNTKQGKKLELVRLTNEFLYSDENNKPKLKPGDIVYLPKHLFADWKDLTSILGIITNSIIISDKLTQ